MGHDHTSWHSSAGITRVTVKKSRQLRRRLLLVTSQCQCDLCHPLAARGDGCAHVYTLLPRTHMNTLQRPLQWAMGLCKNCAAFNVANVIPTAVLHMLPHAAAHVLSTWNPSAIRQEHPVRDCQSRCAQSAVLRHVTSGCKARQRGGIFSPGDLQVHCVRRGKGGRPERSSSELSLARPELGIPPL